MNWQSLLLKLRGQQPQQVQQNTIPGGSGSPYIDPNKIGGDVTTSGVPSMTQALYRLFHNGENQPMTDEETQRFNILRQKLGR